jgi:hypothetical protein
MWRDGLARDLTDDVSLGRAPEAPELRRRAALCGHAADALLGVEDLGTKDLDLAARVVAIGERMHALAETTEAVQ